MAGKVSQFRCLFARLCAFKCALQVPAANSACCRAYAFDGASATTANVVVTCTRQSSTLRSYLIDARTMSTIGFAASFNRCERPTFLAFDKGSSTWRVELRPRSLPTAFISPMHRRVGNCSRTSPPTIRSWPALDPTLSNSLTSRRHRASQRRSHRAASYSPPVVQLEAFARRVTRRGRAPLRAPRDQLVAPPLRLGNRVGFCEHRIRFDQEFTHPFPISLS